MAEENKKETPAKNAPAETKPVAEKANEAASNSSLVKNLIFAAFIILAIFFCCSKLKEKNRINAINDATKLFEEAMVNAPDYYQKLQEARNAFENCLDGKEACDVLSPEQLTTYNENYAKCLAALAANPQISEAESEELWKLAANAHLENPDVQEHIRLQGGARKQGADDASTENQVNDDQSQNGAEPSKDNDSAPAPEPAPAPAAPAPEPAPAPAPEPAPAPAPAAE